LEVSLVLIAKSPCNGANTIWKDVEFLHEIAYPYSTSPEGVSVTNFRYWYDEIAKLNAAHNIGG
jgi:hypothetical protein